MRTSVGFGPPVNGQENLTATGTDQATAFQITAQESVFTTVASGTGCRLPWASGATVSVYNLGVSALLVYPGSGDQIGSGSVNASVSVASGDSATFTSLAAPTSAIPRRWYQQVSGGGGIAGLDISNSGTALGTFTAIDALSGATFSDEGGGVAGLTVPLAVSVVTDGTTTVDPAITLTFDSAAFAITDGGSGNAQVASTGGGGGGPAHYVVTLSATDLTTLNSVPVATGIPTPGVGKKLVFAYGFAQFSGGPSGFPSNPAIKIIYAGDSASSPGLGLVIALDNQQANLNISNCDILSGLFGAATAGFDPTDKSLVITSVSDAGVFGPITSSVLNAGGALYAGGDTFTVDTGDATAAGVVDTVDGGGAVVTYHLTSNGNTYTTTTGEATTATSGSGTGLTLDITVSTPGTGNAQIDLWVQTADALV